MFDKRCSSRPNIVQETNVNIDTDSTAYPEAMAASPMMPNMGYGYPTMAPGMPPVYECPQERVVNRQFVHEVPHIVPINTRIINHHIYRHSYSPCYTCCEENVCCNVYDGCPNRF